MARFQAMILIFICATAVLWEGVASVPTTFYIWNGLNQDVTFSEYGDIYPDDQAEFVIEAPQGLDLEFKVSPNSGCDMIIDVTVTDYLARAGTPVSNPVYGLYVYMDGMYGPSDIHGTSGNPVNKWPPKCSGLGNS